MGREEVQCSGRMTEGGGRKPGPLENAKGGGNGVKRGRRRRVDGVGRGVCRQRTHHHLTAVQRRRRWPRKMREGKYGRQV